MWQMFRKKIEMPTADRALPGRAARAFPVPVEHFVNANRLQPPFPAAVKFRHRPPASSPLLAFVATAAGAP